MTAAIRFEPAFVAADLRKEFARQGIRIVALDGTAIEDKETLLAELGRTLQFPAYYGANWDAAEECLRDIAARQGIALFINRADEPWQRLPREMGTLVSIWLSASNELSKQGSPLQLIFLLERPLNTPPSPPERAG